MSTPMFWLKFRMVSQSTVVLLTIASVGCSAGPANVDEGNPLGTLEQGLTTYGDWTAFGDGQCVIGAQAFYKKKFGVTLKATGVETGNIGSCTYLGACMYWVSTKVRPDPALWNRYEWGSEMPKLYDVVIYPPTASTGYGHIASVDHMEGTDAAAYAKLYVMDSNWTLSEKKSPAIHTTGRKPYGFYRLKSLEGPWCSPGFGGPLNCGGQVGLHDADKASLYSCDGLTAKLIRKCATSCVFSPSGIDDKCADPPPPVEKDAGPDVKPVEDGTSDTHDEAALDDGATAVDGESDAASDASADDSADIVVAEGGERVIGSEPASASCSLHLDGSPSNTGVGCCLAIGALAIVRRRRFGAGKIYSERF